ncbi:hypothetical protein PoB_006890200 [Plakobranchus ocellatus]|uniref:Uncharacterized protein n=1 Tax=Plakobranchus ocellatus TaxID=259542 RepID=A0AAV4DEE0_9GAST|nr:hypothetical protein PoB_006890200 [Plakobranchus ocellatus]
MLDFSTRHTIIISTTTNTNTTASTGSSCNNNMTWNIPFVLRMSNPHIALSPPSPDVPPSGGRTQAYQQRLPDQTLTTAADRTPRREDRMESV